MRTAMQWEYTTLPVNRSFWSGNVKGDVLQKQLDSLGAAGWELVTGFGTNWGQGATNEVVLIFKRPRQRP